jgi:hypothetical protein
MDAFVDSLSEDEAIMLYHKLADKFGWAGFFFTKSDVQTAWRDDMASKLCVDNFDDLLPDDIWNAVVNSSGWQTLTSAMSEYTWDIVYDIVYDVNN